MKRNRGRPPIYKQAMTATERSRRHRAKQRHAEAAQKAQKLIGKARQREVNDRLAAEAKQLPQEARFWERLDLRLCASEVRAIAFHEAASIIEIYEPMPAQCSFAYGLFFGGILGGAVVYGNEYSENLPRVWSKYGFADKLILLSRGACLHWTPKNSGSRTRARLDAVAAGALRGRHSDPRSQPKRGRHDLRGGWLRLRRDEQHGRQVDRQRALGPWLAAHGLDLQSLHRVARLPTRTPASEGARFRLSRIAKGAARASCRHCPSSGRDSSDARRRYRQIISRPGWSGSIVTIGRSGRRAIAARASADDRNRTSVASSEPGASDACHAVPSCHGGRLRVAGGLDGVFMSDGGATCCPTPQKLLVSRKMFKENGSAERSRSVRRS